MVIVDEAGMANDANLARLPLAVRHAHASLVLVGDPHQLDAVGPGGALTALIARHPDLTVTLDHNVRQHDPDERAALAELRDGSVPPRSTGTRDRTHPHPARPSRHSRGHGRRVGRRRRPAGHDSALLAWRRADVTDLNRLARAPLGPASAASTATTSRSHPDAGTRSGTDSSPSPPTPTPRSSPANDSPSPPSTTATSTRRTDDGRAVRITGEGLDAEHLDYGYALTVHRAQGATFDRAHVLAAGGGRELGYVALSRARDHTSIHAIADNLEQAGEDLNADWDEEHHQRWITDTPAHPGAHLEPVRAAPEPPAVAQAASPSWTPVERLNALTADYHDLHAGTGRWMNTPQGAAARARQQARAQLHDARHRAVDPNLRRRERRHAAKSLDGLAAMLDQAEERWSQVGEPTVDRLRDQIAEARCEADQQRVMETRQRLDRQLTSRLPEPDPGRDLAIGLSSRCPWLVCEHARPT